MDKRTVPISIIILRQFTDVELLFNYEAAIKQSVRNEKKDYKGICRIIVLSGRKGKFQFCSLRDKA